MIFRRLILTSLATLVGAVSALVTDISAHPNISGHDLAADDQRSGTAALASHSAQERIIRRSTFETTTRDGHGYHRSTISLEPQNLASEGGPWEDVDTSIKATDERGYAFTSSSTSHELLVPESADGHTRFGIGNEWIDFRLLGSEGRVRATSDQVTMDHRLPGVELSLESHANGIKELIVLDEMPASARFTYHFTTSTGIEPTLKPDNSVTFSAANHERTIFTIPPPIMFDSSGGANRRSSSDIGVTLEPAGSDNFNYTIVADQDWLSDPATKYPVYIDPTITFGPNRDCWIGTQAPDAGCSPVATRLRTGVTNQGSPRRTLLKLNLNGIPEDAVLLAADLSLKVDTSASWGGQADYDVRIPASNWTDAVTWTSPNGTPHRLWSGGGPWSQSDDQSTKPLDTVPIGPSDTQRVSWDVTEAANRWIGAGEINRGFLINQSNEDVPAVVQFYSSSAGSEGFRPKLVIDWVDPDLELNPELARSALLGSHQCAVDQGLTSGQSNVYETYGWVSDDGKVTAPAGPELGAEGRECENAARIDLTDFLGDSGAPDPENTEALRETQSDLSLAEVWVEMVRDGSRELDPTGAHPGDGGDGDDGLALRGATVNPCGSRSNTRIPDWMNRQSWVISLNFQQDRSGRSFIGNYCAPTYFNWNTDNCTASPDSGWYFNFTWACRRHDFGSRNLKRARDTLGYGGMWTTHNKAVTDNQFYADMLVNCKGRSNEPAGPRVPSPKALCARRAGDYVWAVRNLVSPRTGNLTRVRNIQ